MSAPLKEWFSATALANLGLDGMPTTSRGWERMILRERWDGRTDDSGRPLTRARQGRGGGREFHFSLLPIPAQAELVLRARNDIGRKRTTEAERLLVMFDLLAQQVDMARVQLREILAGDGL